MTAIRPSARLAYIDWLRGVAILIMIGAHTFDAWTLPAERLRPGYGRIVIIAGMAAPLFLFLAGVGLALAAAAHLRRGRTNRDASRLVQRRGWQIFGYAFLFRLQSFVLGGFAAPANLLKVDILNVMGPAIAVAGAVWGSARTRVGKAIGLSLAAVAVSIATPILRGSSWLNVLPDPVEWYFQPPKGRGTFTLLPWSAFVFAGAVLGTAIDGAAGRLRAIWFQTALAASGVAALRRRRLGGAPADGLPRRVFLDDVASVCCSASGAYAGDGGHGVALDVAAMARCRSAESARNLRRGLAVRVLGPRRAGLRLHDPGAPAPTHAGAGSCRLARDVGRDVRLIAGLEPLEALAARGP